MQLTNCTTDRDECIVNTLQSLRRTLYNYAIAFRLDVEDLMQESVIIMLEVWSRVPQSANTGAYLFAVVRNSLSRFIPRDDTVSLDAPITETGLTLTDVLPAREPLQVDEKQLDYLIKVVHWALQQLPPEVQLYATETFELTSYQHERRSKKMNEYVMSVYKRRRKADMKKELKTSFEGNPVVLALFSQKKRLQPCQMKRV